MLLEDTLIVINGQDLNKHCLAFDILSASSILEYLYIGTLCVGSGRSNAVVVRYKIASEAVVNEI